MREVKTYSEAFKRGVAGKAGQGVYTSLSGAGHRNGIRRNVTLPERLKKYGR